MIKKALVLASLAVLALATLAGCPPGRYASCQKEEDCPAIDGGKLVCYNFRCVECHYDGDCPAGKVCSGNNTCDSLEAPAADKDKEEPQQAPPTTLEECAKRCKGNPSCGDDCRDRFK